MNESSPEQPKPRMELIDIFRSQERSIPGVVEETGPWYGFDPLPRFGTSCRSKILSVDDEQSWQRLLNTSSQPLQNGHHDTRDDLLSFVNRKFYVWIGEYLLLTCREIYMHELVTVGSVQMNQRQDVFLYVNNTVNDANGTGRDDVRVVNLLTTVLQLLIGEAKQTPRFAVDSHRCDGMLNIYSSAGMQLIKRTNRSYVSIHIVEWYYWNTTLSTDDIHWLATHAKQLAFDTRFLDQARIDSLCEGIANRDSTLEDLSLDFRDEDKDVVIMQSMIQLFREQVPCSLTTLRIDIGEGDAENLADFFDALSHYQGSIANVSVKFDDRRRNWTKWVGWLETLMTSKTITKYVFHTLGDRCSSHAIERLRAALDKNENIEHLVMLYLSEAKPRHDSQAAFSPTLTYRKAKKMWIKFDYMNLRVVDDGQDGTMHSDNTPAAQHYSLYESALSRLNLWDKLNALYGIILEQNNAFTQLWELGRNNKRTIDTTKMME
mmetsp:Transcript_710/g.1713  ORF Transcript_710/g.1713 Transcript_710/m.1713 type:complete len:490 (-) Transcript_710:133-1602(-)